LKQYDVDIDTFSRAETINQISSFQVNETRTLEFPTLGVAITLTNTANEPLWLGVNKSGYEAETIVVQNRRINTDVTSPTFQVSDGSKFDIRISELRDIRIGSNGDASNAPIFNRLDRLINELMDSSAPEVDTLQTLRIAVDDTYKKVNEMSSELSGVINRLSATISSIETQIDLFSSSRSRVEETNYAKEIAEFVQMKAQRDISAATLAHLNVQPKVVLWLLQSDNPIKTTDMTKSKEPRRSHLEIEHVYA
jgi:flagellin-like hook-associated protein FlgL